MGKIFCLIGKSASGKDTIYNALIKNDDLKPIVLYTTRPIRDGEIPDVTYHFVDDKRLEELDRLGKVIEKRTYDTVFGPWTYATVSCDIDLKSNSYLIIGTLQSFVQIKEYFGEEIVIPIYIYIDDEIRYQRAIAREDLQEIEDEEVKAKLEEIKRRFRADEIDFSEENLAVAGIKKRYNNFDFDKCYEEIEEDIKEYL
ncbi:MAG: guanylate kinase [Lachnospiraceae bacterium]|nr:guanylate kinase [Lachnospiraceae bacterium]